MSVYIKGVEMPENCLQCVFFSGQGCKATRSLFPDWMNVAVRAKECPLFPVPPHGRLIDADALIQDNGIDTFLAAFAVANAPTIIPAEEGER